MNSFSKLRVYEGTKTFSQKPIEITAKSTIVTLEPIKTSKHSKKTAQRMYTMDQMFSAETGREGIYREDAVVAENVEPEQQISLGPARWKTSKSRDNKFVEKPR